MAAADTFSADELRIIAEALGLLNTHDPGDLGYSESEADAFAKQAGVLEGKVRHLLHDAEKRGRS